MNVGITGHQQLDTDASWSWVEAELDRALALLPLPLIGLSSLAGGADQTFARRVLKRGGELTVIVPFPDYRRVFTSAAHRDGFDDLLSRAMSTEVLPAAASDEASYLAAGQLIVDRSDLMIAVWNRLPARGLGGTADVVQYALERQRPILILDPNARLAVRQPLVTD